MAKTNQKKATTKVTDKRNLKYGSLSVTISVIFVALVIILNVIATSLSSVHGWYTDMTASGYYSLSDEFIDEMDKLVYPQTGEKVYINNEAVRNFLSGLSITSRYSYFSYGLFSYDSLIYFISLSAVFLFLTIRVFEKRRWSKS